MDYQTEVEKDASDFLSGIEADIKAAILLGEEDVSNIECDESGYGNIRDAFFEAVEDRSYSIEDAAYVIANCEDEETDTGLWEGREMHEAMQVCAAVSYGHDVWSKVTEIYDGMFDGFEPSYIVVDADDDTVKEFIEDGDAEDWIESQPGGVRGLWVKEGRGNIDKLWQEYEDDNTTKPIEVGGTDELFALRRWVKMSEKAGTWGGYPLSGSYIDSRCGTGYSMPEVKDFVNVDHETGLKLPHMRGKYIDAVRDRIEELVGNTRKPYSVTVELEAEQWGEIVTRLHGIATQIADGGTTGVGWNFRNQNRG